MINQYGADAVRWFILSDSPPEKDVQWSDVGVLSANKFLQKIWNLNLSIINRKEKKIDKKEEKEFSSTINNFIIKIDNSINSFRFNVSIALFYEIFTYVKNSIEKGLSNSILKENITKIMIIMIPFIPHLASECLEGLNCKNTNNWPKVDKTNVSELIKVAIQVNGKTRDIIKIERDNSEQEIHKEIMKDSKAKKYIENKKIRKTIFVKNKIINYII